MKKTCVVILLLGLAVLIGGGTGAYLAIMRDLPQVADLKDFRPSGGSKVYANDDHLIGEFKPEKGIYVRFDAFPKSLVDAVIATEDAQFWSHPGIDLYAIARAIVKDIRSRRFKEGASTITQQLSKILFLSPEKKLRRKLQELAIAIQIERTLSKEQILELYLNKVYFGHGAYGIEMAARTYFDKNVAELSLGESAMLAGLIKAPNAYSPIRHPDRSRSRQRIVLGRMVATGFITDEEARITGEHPLRLTTGKRRNISSYFLEFVRKELESRFSMEEIYGKGLRVYTSLDRRLQKAAERAVKDGLLALDKRRGWRGPESVRGPKEPHLWETKAPLKSVPAGDLLLAEIESVSDGALTVRGPGYSGTIARKDALWVRRARQEDGSVRTRRSIALRKEFKPGMRVRVRLKKRGKTMTSHTFSLEQLPEAQAALVCLDPARGYIRAMVGGYDFRQTEFNRAVAARRQPGSAFKPILYATALSRGFTPADLLMDEEIEYSGEVWGDWKPGNYDKKYYGPTSLRDGLTYSRNVVSIKLLEFVGIDRVIKTARRMGFQGPFPRDLTLGLGSLTASPLEVVSAYGVFAAGGVHVPPTPLRYVLDARGNLLPGPTADPEQALDAVDAFLVTSMMEDVVKRGTGWRARAIGRPVAGKTGTTNEYRDAWFIGFTPNLVAGVWVGLDDMASLGKKETGSRAAAPIWVAFMKEAVRDLPTEEFRMPEGVTTALIDADTGLLATADTPRRMVEFFRDGSEPTEYTSRDLRDEILRLKIPVEAKPEFD